ncbi:primosomal protein N' [Methylocella silvestris BL2]|uniref:Replication restart protein PriA n=1 Tax=Methylocella silvestris (strain DSM 15510 / CIP 108128 / LMG 27833 / NCIMB 13906 / BL2) TaxID=395965 RepID=B8EQ16_METSB|nr:primosomal protein N' [Methylocella silvestris]ACK51506.1 primosomal protein N' [Methylocella silvestris BL2]
MPAAESVQSVVDVLFPVAVDTAYSYVAPAAMGLVPGAFVEAPLGPRRAIGVVFAQRPAPPGASNLRAVAARLDISPLGDRLRDFIDWVARWGMSPRGMVLRMAIRAPFHAAPEPKRVGLRLTGAAPARLTPARERTLAAAQAGGLMTKAALAKAAGVSASVIDGLIRQGVFTLETLAPEPAAPVGDPDFRQPLLSQDQAAAAAELAKAVLAQSFSVTLLEGVTGSGKTETYFEAIAAALRAGRQTLVLLPEIALTSQFVDRFGARFGAAPVEWHSGIGAARRARIWSAVASGEAKIIIGARSALFLPFQSLGLVIVDEEHDGAYKQEDGVVYHARDMAVVRGRIEQCAVILASATPSIETRVNADQGRYRRLVLKDRFGGRAMPKIEAVDMRLKPPPRGKWISPALIAALADNLGKGQQSLLFLNRRGYAPLTLCRSCGHRFQCPNCAAWLVDHRFRKALICHHCGHMERRPELCPNCEAVESLMACGPGVERLEEEAAELFPDARLMILSSDLAGGAERLRAEFEAVARGACDIVIGTQLVAKGHNFPGLTLVGVIDADIGLTSGDPRAAERTFQLLQQVTGRAGRFETPGRALVQSFQPEHPVMRAILSGDSEKFYAEEIEQRRRAGLPPFGRLAALIVSGNDAASAEAFARALARAAHDLPRSDGWTLAAAGGLPTEGELSLLGPAEAPIAILRGRHRFRLLIRAPRSSDLQGFLNALLAAGPPQRGGVNAAIDIDPQSFL